MKSTVSKNTSKKEEEKKTVKKSDKKDENKKEKTKTKPYKKPENKSKTEEKKDKKENTIKKADYSKDYIKQITEYYEFKNYYKFLTSLTDENLSKIKNKEQQYYIVSEKWIKAWKIFVNYKDFKKLVSEKLDITNNIIEDWIKKHPNNLPPGKIDEDLKGKTSLDVINEIQVNKTFNLVSEKFYNLFPHNEEIKFKLGIKGIGKNFKFIIYPSDKNISNKENKCLVIDHAPNLDGAQANKTFFVVRNKNIKELLDMTIEKLRDPNNKDIEFRVQKVKKQNINNNNEKNIIRVNPEEYKKSLPKQEIEGVKEVTYVGLERLNEKGLGLNVGLVKLNEKGLGLNNIGSTCYMNSTLQCLSNTGSLTRYFLKKENRANFEKQKNDKKIKDKISPYFADVIYHLWDAKNKSSGFSPYEFKQKLGELNPLFAQFAAGDSKDLLNYLIMQMHEELNASKTDKNKNQNFDIRINQTNEQEVLKSFYDNFTKNYNSKISNVFYGCTKSQMICQNCGIITYNFDLYFFLIFPLEKVRTFKSLFCGMNVNSVNIYECLTEEQMPALLDGYCNYCKRNTNLQQRTSLYTLPNYLIIILNRGRGNEFNVGYQIDEYIDLMNFVEFREDIAQFYLNGVIVHLGPSGESGHFIAYCCSPIDHKWYCYNDSIVTFCEKQNIAEQIGNRGTPYILFYKKCKK